ncbi:MAG: hypothetical protein A3G07_00660 [Candidatus Doudnabacteria bacterium RIFCSPLOWO2_12_FULL_47_12]|nr:MAG: hypothetical protein A3G07_00660 [Candidatus Doudnabacteria bacterium RIFCSPLOWO2_12_FULL_47_12]
MAEQMFIILPWLLAALIVGLAAVFWYRGKLRLRLAGEKLLDSVFLEVLLPRENTVADKEKEPAKEEKEMIAVAEQLFATLGHAEKRNFTTFLRGHETISFEIISVDKKISFLINCPSRLRDLLEKQIQAQYPTAQIDEVLPPKIIRSSGKIAAHELGLQKKYLFPIKTYKVMESDPLNALANSLSKLGEKESAALQLVVGPAPLGWRAKILQRAREIQKGRDIEMHDDFLLKVLNVIASEIGEFISGSARGQKSPPPDGTDPVKGAYKQLTPLQQDAVKKLEEKASKNAFEVNLRAVVCSETAEAAASHMRNILASFMQYTHSPFNGFRILRKPLARTARDYVFRALQVKWPGKIILNTEELSSIFHFPTKYNQTPNIKWLTAKRAPAPLNIPKAGLLLGMNNYRGVKTEVRIAPDDRRRHMYIIGRTGTGKSEFMKNLAIQDIQNGQGLAVIDPHGDLVESLLQHIPKNRVDDVVLFEPFDMARPMGLNMLEVDNDEEKDFAVQEMIEIFYKLFPPEMIGPMFEHNMRNVMLTLMSDKQYPGTIAEIPRMFTDPEFQRYKLTKVNDPVVRSFWEQEMAKTSDFHKSEMLGYLISKVGRFVENEMMRNIIGQSHSAFNFRKIMDEGKILLINLSKGKTGEVNSKLLGLIIVSKLQMGALSRSDIPETSRKDFYLYIDEFQNFVTDSLATILSEARKYRLNLVMAHQYISQLVHENNTKIRDAVFGNAGTIVSFRIGVEDAEIMAREFSPVFNDFDVINVERFHAYVKLMLNGTASRSFNLETILPARDGSESMAAAVKKLSKLKYGRLRDEVEAEISRNARLGKMPAAAGIERTV